MRPTSTAIGVFVLAIVFVLARPSGAQEAESWRYHCLGDEVEGSKICTTELASFYDGEEFIVYFVHVGKGKPPLVISGENEGIAEAAVEVDKNAPLSSRECEGGACFFSPSDSEVLMKQFRKGARAKVTVTAANDEIVFDRVISLSGFTAALAGPRR